MTADINVILQLLQRQMAPVPPAYSSVSSSTLPSNSPGLYGTGTPVLHSLYPISPTQMDSRTPKQVHDKKHFSHNCIMRDSHFTKSAPPPNPKLMEKKKKNEQIKKNN